MRPFALVICAKNEAAMIRSTVLTALKAVRPGDALFVIADNCTDQTAALARRAGAEVFIRDQKNLQGKGAAISWMVKNYTQRLLSYSYLVILDADSMIKPDFITVLDQGLTQEMRVAQCFVSPIGYENSPIATLIALSEIVEQTMFDHLRNKVGWSVRLRGAGMVFSPEILMGLNFGTDSEVEDIVLSLLLAERKIKIHQISHATVYDPKPPKAAAASRQRARWFRGQWRTLWKYRRLVMKTLISGPEGFSLMGSLFLKPRWMKLSALLLLGVCFIGYPWVSIPILSLMFIEILLILMGLIRLPDRQIFIRALWYLPGFVLMWMKGIFLSIQNKPWLRVRDTQEKKDCSGTGYHYGRRDWDEWLKHAASQKGIK